MSETRRNIALTLIILLALVPMTEAQAACTLFRSSQFMLGCDVCSNVFCVVLKVAGFFICSNEDLDWSEGLLNKHRIDTAHKSKAVDLRDLLFKKEAHL